MHKRNNNYKKRRANTVDLTRWPAKQKWGEGFNNASQARDDPEEHVTSKTKEIECKEFFEKQRGENHNETIAAKENRQKEARIIVREEIIKAHTLPTQYIHTYIYRNLALSYYYFFLLYHFHR